MPSFQPLYHDIITSLTPATIESLSQENVNMILAKLIPAQIQFLTSNQMQALTTAQIQALTTAQIQALTTAQIQALTPKQLALLTSGFFSKLTSDQQKIIPSLFFDTNNNPYGIVYNDKTIKILAADGSLIESINFDNNVQTIYFPNNSNEPYASSSFSGLAPDGIFKANTFNAFYFGNNVTTYSFKKNLSLSISIAISLAFKTDSGKIVPIDSGKIVPIIENDIATQKGLNFYTNIIQQMPIEIILREATPELLILDPYLSANQKAAGQKNIFPKDTVLSLNSTKTEDIKKLQDFLTSQNYFDEYGIFGKITQQTIASFQFNNALPLNSIFAEKTVAAANKKIDEASTSSTSPFNKENLTLLNVTKFPTNISISYAAPNNSIELIKQLQNFLTFRMWFDPYGTFKNNTKKAVIAFQKKYNINPDGIFSDKTIEAANKIIATSGFNKNIYIGQGLPIS